MDNYYQFKMWLISFLIVPTFAAVTFHFWDKCRIQSRFICDINRDRGAMFPDSETGMEEFCLEVKRVAGCFIEYNEECPNKREVSTEFMQALLDTSNEFCQENSTWFKGVIKYSSCYNGFMKSQDFIAQCSSEIVEKFDQVYSDMPDVPGLYKCYTDIEITSCIIEKMTKECGKLPKELGLHFLQKTGFFWNIICSNFKEEASKLMEDINISFDPTTSEEEFATLFENEPE